MPNDNKRRAGSAWIGDLIRKDDWWAIWIGGLLLLICLIAVILGNSQSGAIVSVLKPLIAKPGGWDTNLTHSLFPAGKPNKLTGVLGVGLATWALFAIAAAVTERKGKPFLIAFPSVFLLATLAFVLAGQAIVAYYSLSYALWALVLGLVISNTVGTPQWLRPAVRTELYIKTGLVILGAEVLFSKLAALGVPGIFVAWVVTPTVLISTFWFGQRILRIPSASLNMVISADMSVCGVSAAIATAAACKAKKEELSVAIGMSLTFTVIMMVLMPAFIQAVGISTVVGGAWMGGTIDSTGAVGAAGAILGDEALTVAVAIKMIQNVLIGVVAFFVAVYWVTYQTPGQNNERPGLGEIWNRFPKFILGFLAASCVFSLVYSLHPAGEQLVGAVISGGSKTLRGWLFCLAFVSIGLETRFADLSQQLRGGKPLVLYLVGQSLNLGLTLLMAWLMFDVVFPGAADALQP